MPFGRQKNSNYPPQAPPHQQAPQQQYQQYPQYQQYQQQHQQYPPQQQRHIPQGPPPGHVQPQQQYQQYNPPQQPLQATQTGPAAYNRGRSSYDALSPPSPSHTLPPQASGAQAQAAPGQTKGWWKKITSIPVIPNSNQDGDTEDETVLANALCKFYGEQRGGIPTWLATCKAAQKYGSGHSTPSVSPHASVSTQGGRSGSSLQDIYKRREQQPQPPVHQQQAPVQESWRTGGGAYSQQQQPPAGQANKNDRFRDRLKSAGRPGYEMGGGNSYSAPQSQAAPSTSSWKNKATW